MILQSLLILVCMHRDVRTCACMWRPGQQTFSSAFYSETRSLMETETRALMEIHCCPIWPGRLFRDVYSSACLYLRSTKQMLLTRLFTLVLGIHIQVLKLHVYIANTLRNELLTHSHPKLFFTSVT